MDSRVRVLLAGLKRVISVLNKKGLEKDAMCIREIIEKTDINILLREELMLLNLYLSRIARKPESDVIQSSISAMRQVTNG